MKESYLLNCDSESLDYLRRQAGLLQAEGRNGSVASILRTLINLHQTDPNIRRQVRQLVGKVR